MSHNPIYTPINYHYVNHPGFYWAFTEQHDLTRSFGESDEKLIMQKL